ncbi:MAG: acyl-CoA dehydrogenase family protein [Acidimicrobiales bacterium]|nr:acyl-CoA dehydrogenase family protein [Acidimicrobiales bacterium]
MTTDQSDPEQRLVELTDRLLAENDPTDRTAFLGAQFDAGLAFVHFPDGAGGLGLAPKLQKVVDERIVAAGGPARAGDIGHGMAAPTIAACGTPEQRGRWLRPLFTREEVWCQMFSEPGAGSDVAGLATRAVRDGDEWVVNGQKVWTSLAHASRWGLLLARTDPEAAKHKGMTYFVIDLHQPGVEVRPLRQLTGQAEFNEVYFTDALVADADRLGDVGDGWRVALTTLMNERVSIGGGVRERGEGTIEWALDAWRAGNGADPVMRDRLVRLWVEAEVLRLTNMRAAAARKAGTPGPEGSVGKLFSAELNQRITELAVTLMGPAGMTYDEGYDLDPERFHNYRSAQGWFLRSRANSIEGGTSEIMRNILGERVLGLPGDLRVDKDRAWSDIPRS